MTVPGLGADIVTILRVATMLVFIATFVGIVAWLMTPSGRRAADAQARDILRDDIPRDDPRPEARP